MTDMELDTENTSSQRLHRVRHKLATKVMVAIILVVILPLVFAGWFPSYIANQRLQEQASNTVEDVAVQVASQLNQTLLHQVQLSETFTKIKPLRDQIVSSNVGYTGSEADIQAQLADLNEAWQIAGDEDALIINVTTNNERVNFAAYQLRELASAFPAQSDMLVTDRYGGLVAATRRVPDYLHVDKQWWQAAWNDGQGAIFIGAPQLNPETGVRGMTMALPIRQGGVVIGIFYTILNVQIFDEILAFNTFGEGGQGHIVVVDGDGAVMLDPNLAVDKLGAQLPVDLQTAGVLISPRSGAVQTTGLNVVWGEAFHGYAKAPQQTNIPAIDTLNWTTLAILPSAIAMAPTTTASRWQMGLTGALVILIIVAMVIFLRRQTRQLTALLQTFEQLKQPDYAARAEIISQDELGQIAVDLNTVLDNTLNLMESSEERDQLEQSIMKLLEEVSDVAEGDLTVEAEVTAEVTGAIADSFNYMISQLRQIISDVQETIVWVTSSAREIQLKTEKLALGSEAQARRIGSASIEIQSMAASIRHVSENAAESVHVAREARKSAQLGTLAVQDTIKGMKRIQEKVEETGKRITRLGEGSYEIGEIVSVINDIADRTSILALNASIQAAAAGEAGRGFGVVASEVEELATQAAQATRQISGIIKTVQTEIEETVSAMEESSREVDIGTRLSDQAGRRLSEIDRVSVSLTELILAISRSAEHQADRTEDVATSINKIADLTKNTADSTRETARSIDDLRQLTDGLRKSVSTFRLPTSNQNGYLPSD